MRRRTFLVFLNPSKKHISRKKENLDCIYVKSLEQMRLDPTINRNDAAVVWPQGYSSIGDCKMPLYRWDSREQREDNSGTIIQPQNYSSSGRWVAILDDYINVDWFGAGLGEDDTKAISKAIEVSLLQRKKVKFTSGKIYRVSSTIKAIGSFILEGSGKVETIIECNFSGACFDLNGYGCEVRGLNFKNKAQKGGTAIRISGRVHTFENLRFEGPFEKCIHLTDVWESNFDKINILNGYPQRKGVGLLVEYSVNNTISNCYFSYNTFAIKFTPKYSPANYRSEGWLISNSIFIDSMNGIFAEGITHISIQNCIFDFIFESAIYLAYGFSGIISGNWLSSSANDTTLLVTHKSFNGVKVIGNEFVGSIKNLENQSSMLITSNQNIIGNNRHIGIKSGKNFGKINIQSPELYVDFKDLQDNS
jgi:hypothetical protein